MGFHFCIWIIFLLPPPCKKCLSPPTMNLRPPKSCGNVFYWVLVLNSGLLYKFCQTIKCRANWRPARAPRGWNEATERHQERRTQMETEMGGISTTYWHRLCTCTDRRAEKLVMDGNNCWFHK
uniref:Putative uncharacterized protein PKD1L1-AS1 n=1 Tax=Homo sapiens TaxID=9606 RepID=CG069_HUMAN|eukprot:NP_079307.2 uncharacterized protein C7orf69 isoform a precursor [Homo sapiens]